MDRDAAIAALESLGLSDSNQAVSNVEDGSTSLLRTKSGSSIALLRRGHKYDTLVVGAQADCPVPSLRAVLETAVLPLSDSYAAHIGVAVPERDAVRKRIREASVALDVIAKGRHFSVAPPDLPVHAEIRKQVELGVISADQLPESIVNDLAILNQLQSNVVAWSREIDRVVQVSRTGPADVLTVEEETVFWSSLDAALSASQQRLSTAAVRITLEVLARKRRATGFLIDASNSIEQARRKAAAVLSLIQGLPIVALRTADDLLSLRNGATGLLEHVAAKLRASSFSVERVLSLVESMASDVSRSIGRILSRRGGLLEIPFDEFVEMFQSCCELFEAWSHGFDHCRRVAREAARKKGQAMPPRRKSPLSDLHSHLSHVYELRSDHQALRAVLLDLSATVAGFKRLVQNLDSSYALVMKESVSFDHFEVVSTQGSTWVRISSTYRSQVAKIEKSVTEAYGEIVRAGCNIYELSRSLRPFWGVLEHPFMSIAVTEVIPDVLEVGRRDFASLRSREVFLSSGRILSRLEDIPCVALLCSEVRLLQTRVSELLTSIESIVGKTQLEVTPDLRDFVTDVNQLKRRCDPSVQLSSWLDRINLNAHNASLFAVVRSADGDALISFTLDSDAALFFKVVRQVRHDRKLVSSLSSRHLEFSRASKALFPTYCNVKEAAACYNTFSSKLGQLEDLQYERIVPFLVAKRIQTEHALEEGLRKQWSDPSSQLLTYSSRLCKESLALANNLHVLVERDAVFESAIEDLYRLHPNFSRGRVSPSTVGQLQNFLKRYSMGMLSLRQTLKESDAAKYVTERWVPMLNSALVSSLERLTTSWAMALKSGDLALPTIIVDATYRNSSGGELVCTPSIAKVEQFLYNSLGDAYACFANAVEQGFRDLRLSNTYSTYSGFTSADVVLFHFLDNRGKSEGYAGPDLSLSLIDIAIQQVQQKAECWSSFLGYLNPVLHDIISQLDNTVENPADVLEQITKTYEDVNSLEQGHGLSLRGAVEPMSYLPLDSSALSQRILSNVLNALTRLCDQTSSEAADKSQSLYQRISDSKSTILAASHVDGTEMLAALQAIKEEVLPTCEAAVASLCELERKFDSIAERVGDFTFSRAQTAETWILSDELVAHLKSLQDLYDQRIRSVLVNRDILQVKYKETRQSYQSSLTEVFARFQRIRNEDSRDDDLFDSTSALDDLEKQLQALDEQALSLERVGRALGCSQISERNGPKTILSEVEKVKNGIERLCCVEEKVALLSKSKLRDVDPSSVRNRLAEWTNEVGEIANSSGAKREANYLGDKLAGLVQANSFLSGLHSVVLSPPRERDLMRRLFGESYPKGGIRDISLEMFWHADVLAYGKYLRTVFENAAGEASICEFLNGIERTWSGRKCSFALCGGIAILQEIPYLLEELEEHMQGLETLRASQHALLFESDRAAWEQRLGKLREDLELLSDVQSRWAHLGTLFGSGGNAGVSGLRSELLKEFSAFSNVHARFSALGERMESAPGILEGLEGPLGLDEMKEELDGIVRGLSAFLEKQRSVFPRFFFLPDKDLLHVLSISSLEIEGFIPHVGKIFPGLSTFEFEKEKDQSRIFRLLSKEGEVLEFREPFVVPAKESITSWLLRLQELVISVMKNALGPAVALVESKYGQVFSGSVESFLSAYLSFPVQIAVLGTKLCFTKAVESCLRDAGDAGQNLRRLACVVEGFLLEICSSKPTRGSLGTATKFWLGRDQLIKELIYQRDLLSLLRNEEVTSVSSHYWQYELRFYQIMSAQDSRPSESLVIRCGTGEFSYGWEYLGVGETLVHTQLTSRCFLTLTDALRRGFGGSPFGPAGTGKTETVKALGRIIGRFVAVFNCDESFDAISVGRILAGASRLGSWVCFDEFNRLSASILSSTSGQLAALQAAIRRGNDVVNNFYGGDLPVSIKPGVGVFVTMNPKYSGRRELPANLKSLFRPCAMSKPDSTVIAEVLLLSQGFKSSNELAQKLVSFFRNLESMLGVRPHYDFGLRSLKSTVFAAGSLLGSSHSMLVTDCSAESREEDIVIRALGEILKPKLDAFDTAAYECAIKVIFTKATCLSPKLSPEIEAVLSEVLLSRHLITDDVFVGKIRELFSLLQHQNGIMLVGPAGSGKSEVWRTLYEVLKRLSNQISHQDGTGRKRQCRSSLTVLDAKLLASKQLYGDLDAVSREWSDGVFAKLLRGILEGARNEARDEFPLHWIVFDGDVDPDWVENLNSVLDDNRILTLPSGEQLPLLSNTRILFEIDHLKHANPSTVSRCGMVCFGESSWTENAFISSVASLLSEVCPECPVPRCLSQIAQSVVQISRQVLEDGQLVIAPPLQSLLDSVLRLLRVSLLKLLQPSRSSLQDETATAEQRNDGIEVTKHVLLRIFLVVIVKGIAAGLVRAEQCEISKSLWEKLSILDEVRDAMEGVGRPYNFAEVAITPNGVYQEYSELVPSRRVPIRCADIGSPDLVISTPTTVRLEALLRDSLHLGALESQDISPLILCGPPGCGKSMLLTAVLRDTPNISLATLSFSSQTSPDNILAALRGHTVISKRPNGSLILHPKATGCRVVLFCDEVNLERPDEYGTQRSISFLRSVAEHRGFWHGNPPCWISVKGVEVVAACNPEQDSGRHKLSPRFLRHCSVVQVELPNSNDLRVIYGVFVDSMLRSLHEDLASKTVALTSAMVEFFSLNKERFCPYESGPLEPHYIYSPRELSRWIRGMKVLLNIESEERERFTNTLHSGISGDMLWSDVLLAFCYEGRRIFCDRLLRQEEQSYAESKLSDVAKNYLCPDYDGRPDLFYTSWLHSSSARKTFQVVKDPQQFRTLVYQKLRVFAEEEGLGGSWMGGVSDSIGGAGAMIDQFAVTDDVLTHLSRIERILCQSLGHAVLMGAPGTGKKTLARFAAWMLSIEVHQVHSHSTYSEQDFANDLRVVLCRAGVSGHQVMMIFDESNAMDSAFLEMMNSVLACGEVPGLFSGDERTRLLEDLRATETQNASSVSTEQAVYAEFVKRVRSNLHIVFSISSGCSDSRVNTDERHRVRAGGDISERSPALYNRCTVDWIGDWTKETLDAVADLKIEVALGTEKDQIIRSAVEIHETARRKLKRLSVSVDVTPRHYLEFIEQINRLALEKGNEIQAGADRHTEGLRRLESAGNALDDLKEALSHKSDHLQRKEVHANETLKKMIEEQRLAEKSKVAAEQLALAAKDASLRVQEREEEVAGQLAEVQPKIQAAREAVGSIRREYLEELRAMPNPPSGVRIALEGVMMVLDATSRKPESQYSWGSIRTRMRGSDFITSIVNFDADSLPKGLRSRIERKVLQNPDFDVNRISYASRAAGPLAEWTLTVLDYAAVKEAVEPLQEEVSVLQEEQGELLDRQEAALKEITVFQERIENCKTEYASLVSEAERIRQEIQDSEANLRRSEEMLQSLDDEFSRWVKELNSFNEAAVNVWGNAVYGAAFIAYAGILDHSNRSAISNEWKEVLRKEGIDFDSEIQICNFLTSPEERGLWSTRDLPTDATSLENYAILKRSARFPLLVDPSRNSCNLLRRVVAPSSVSGRENSKESTELRMSESSFTATGKKSYMRALEAAMRFGTTIVLEDADKFDRAVAPLLGQESSYGDASEAVGSAISSTGSKPLGRRNEKRGNNVCRRVVRLGDRDVFLSPNFRLYLATVDIRGVPTSAITRSNVVSFELSPAALQSSCISSAMRILLPDLEARRKASLLAKLEYDKRKHDLEEKVLSAITDVEDLGTEILGGSLLDNLSNLKQEVETIEERQKEELRASLEITQAESLFAPLGQTTVDAFSVVQSLSALNPVYMFHTTFFLSVLDAAIAACKHSPGSSLDSKVLECRSSVLKKTFQAVAPSLFPKDRVPFASALALASLTNRDAKDGKTTSVEDFVRIRYTLYVILRLPESVTASVSHEDDKNAALQVIPRDLQAKLRTNPKQNVNVTTTCSAFDSALRVLRRAVFEPHRVFEEIDVVACTLPGRRDLIHGRDTGSEASLYAALASYAEKDSSETKPADGHFPPVLLCARGQNSDPATLVVDIANRLNIPIMSIAIGIDNTDDAVSEALSVAIRRTVEGRKMVILFKNMHLAAKPVAERLHAEIMKRNGRLPCLVVVAVEISSQVPSSLLLRGAPFFRLFAFETPPSFRANFSSALDKIAALRELNSPDWQYPLLSLDRLHIAASWLHATILERSLHAPVGFTRHYDFSESDLLGAWDVIVSRAPRSIDFEEYLKGVLRMLSISTYGCRIEHETDLDVVGALVSDIFSLKNLTSTTGEDAFTVLESEESDRNLTIPVREGKRNEYVRAMPSEAPPQWARMPSDTNKKRQVAEGRQALDKVLLLSQQKYGAIEQKMDAVLHDGQGSKLNLDSILCFGKDFPAVRSVCIETKELSPLQCYLEAESRILAQVVATVKRDIESLAGESIVLTKRVSRTAQLREELDRILHSELRALPATWFTTCPYFGRELSISEFFAKLRLSVSVIDALQASGGRDINLSAALRPEALLEALKCEDSVCRRISPHSLELVVTGEAKRGHGSRSLTGVYLNGLVWEVDTNVFKRCQGHAVLAHGLGFAWEESQSGTGKANAGFVYLPLYGTVSQASPLTSVKIPVEVNSSVEDWKLCGASLSLDFL